MKKFVLLFSIPALFAMACKEQPQEPENKNLLSTDLVKNPRSATGIDSTVFTSLPKMDFKDTVHNFGTIKQGEVISFEFEFTNTGETPLIISAANGSCGCTVADFPNEPVPPGKSSSISVQFASAGKEGRQEKTVSLTTNATRGTRILYIKGNIEK